MFRSKTPHRAGNGVTSTWLRARQAGLADVVPVPAAGPDIEVIAPAVAELRAIADPYRRLLHADGLDAALGVARSVVAQIRQDTVRSLRGSAAGYGTIAQRLGLTKSRVQQIANAPARQVVAAYAIRNQGGQWHGQPTSPSGSATAASKSLTASTGT